MLLKQSDPARAILVSQASRPRITPERHTRTIVGRSSSAVEHEFAEARIAWKRYRSTRERDAVYDYLRLIINVSQGGRGETEKAIMCSVGVPCGYDHEVISLWLLMDGHRRAPVEVIAKIMG
jgi:hypothetical protein